MSTSTLASPEEMLSEAQRILRLNDTAAIRSQRMVCIHFSGIGILALPPWDRRPSMSLAHGKKLNR